MSSSDPRPYGRGVRRAIALWVRAAPACARLRRETLARVAGVDGVEQRVELERGPEPARGLGAVARFHRDDPGMVLQPCVLGVRPDCFTGGGARFGPTARAGE